MPSNAESSVPLAEALRRKYTVTEFDDTPTHRPGVSLRVLKGATVQMTTKNLRNLVWNATNYTRRKGVMDKEAKAQTTREKDIKQMVAGHEGLRGLTLTGLKKRLQVFPQVRISWNEQALRDKLGPAQDTVLTKEVVLGLKLALGHETKRGPLTPELAQEAVFLGFLAIGFKPDDEPKIVTSKTVLHIDEEQLYRRSSEGLFDPEGTGEARETMVIRVDQLRE